MHHVLSSAAVGEMPTVRRCHPVDLILAPDGIQGEGNPFDIEASVAFRGLRGQACSALPRPGDRACGRCYG
jgi:hypothetical protein